MDKSEISKYKINILKKEGPSNGRNLPRSTRHEDYSRWQPSTLKRWCYRLTFLIIFYGFLVGVSGAFYQIFNEFILAVYAKNSPYRVLPNRIHILNMTS